MIEQTPTNLPVTQSRSDRVLVLGVNPFEDVPGYQLLGILREELNGGLHAADDSIRAISILARTGTRIARVPHPRVGLRRYLKAVRGICDRQAIELLLPASDAHVSALSEGFSLWPSLADICPQLQSLANRNLFNKWTGQQWLSSIGHTPARWPYRTATDLVSWRQKNSYPIMVKGMRKGAVKCRDEVEAVVARRTILNNPANHGHYGGAYLEAEVDGEERSLLVVAGSRGKLLACVSIRKIAITTFGTTLAAEVEDCSTCHLDVEQIAASFQGPGIVEIEWRTDRSGLHWLFEANFRFPSWIGALKPYGEAVVRAFIEAAMGSSQCDRPSPQTPQPGTLLYRLPESGIIPLPDTFRPSIQVNVVQGSRHSNGILSHMPLWKGRAPHKFLVK